MVVASISWLVEAQHVSNNDFHMNNPNGDSNNRLFKVRRFYFFFSLHTVCTYSDHYILKCKTEFFGKGH